MDYIKKFSVLLMLSSSLFSFSQKPLKVDKENFAHIENVTDSCYEEIRSGIKGMLGSNTLKLSKKLFVDSSYIDITNASQKYFQFLLHKSNGDCILSRVVGSTVISSKKLINCGCK